MLPKFPGVWSSLMIGLLLIAPAAQAGIFQGHPYQDPYFNLDSTPRYGGGSLATATHDDHAGFAPSMETATCPSVTGMGASAGSRGGVCPPVTNAILRLSVPDGFHVEINGQATKPQTLAGIHRNSRVFSLEGLHANRVSPCDIVVASWDELGNPIRLRRALSVRAGGHYDVRFPSGFEPVPHHGLSHQGGGQYEEPFADGLEPMWAPPADADVIHGPQEDAVPMPAEGQRVYEPPAFQDALSAPSLDNDPFEDESSGSPAIE